MHCVASYVLSGLASYIREIATICAGHLPAIEYYNTESDVDQAPATVDVRNNTKLHEFLTHAVGLIKTTMCSVHYQFSSCFSC